MKYALYEYERFVMPNVDVKHMNIKIVLPVAIVVALVIGVVIGHFLLFREEPDPLQYSVRPRFPKLSLILLLVHIRLTERLKISPLDRFLIPQPA